MKRKYTVEFKRKLTRTVKVEVDAFSPEDAIEQIQKHNYDFRDEIVIGESIENSETLDVEKVYEK